MRLMCIALGFVLVAGSQVRAQEPEMHREGHEWQERAHQRPERPGIFEENARLELEERESELHFRHEMQEIELEKARIALENSRNKHDRGVDRHKNKCKKCHGAFMVFCMVVNLLLAIWVYTDIRRRNRGSGLWIVITLLAGFFGALIYAVVRLGDTRETQ